MWGKLLYRIKSNRNIIQECTKKLKVYYFKIKSKNYCKY